MGFLEHARLPQHNILKSLGKHYMGFSRCIVMVMIHPLTSTNSDRLPANGIYSKEAMAD